MQTYKVIIAGCRDYNQIQKIEDKLFECFRNGEFGNALPLEIVSGGANGVDAVGETIAKIYKLKLTVFPAEWGKFRNAAGPIRNAEMAEYADCLLAFWDGKSKGTKNMISVMKQTGKKVLIFDINELS